MRRSAYVEWDELGDVGDEETLPGSIISERGPVTFPTSLLRIVVRLALGADLTADPSTWEWTEIPSELVRYSAGITCSTGRLNESSTASPGNGSLTFDNRDGRFSRRNPLGPYYGLLTRNTPIWIEIDPGDGGYSLMEHFVNEWPVEIGPAGADYTVPVRTAGVLRRLGIGTSATQSAMRRAILGDADLVQYWPCEDGEDSNTLASALGVGTSMAMVGTVAPGTSTAVGAGTDPLPVLSTGTTYLKGSTAMPSSTEWTYGATFYFTSVPVWTSGDGMSYLLYVPASTAGTLVRWLVYWNDADDRVYLEVRTDSTTVATVAGPTLTNAEMVNCWLTFWVSARQNGTDVDYAFGVERTTTTGSSSQGTSGSIVVQTVYQVTAMLVHNGKSAAATTVGHAFVLSRALTATENTPCYQAPTAYTGETATARLTRLCAEAGVPFTLTSIQGESAAMGAQSRSTFLSLLRDCEAADGGALFESGWGLGYQALNARYNQAPAVVMDYAAGHLAERPIPTDDDSLLRNVWEVSRTDGTSFTARDETSIAVEGEYPDSATLNLERDDQTDQAATWLVHLGTQEDHRWPSISLRFERSAATALLPAWRLFRLGDRITIANPPYQVMTAGDLIDVIVEGKSERVDQFSWFVELFTSPARPYGVLQLDDPTYGRLSLASTLSVARDTDDTSFTIAITDTSMGVLWSTTAVPFDIAIGGERMTVTAVAGTSSPQTFTVTRSVNGIVKSHAAHTAALPVPVTLWRPAVLSR